jgi:threonine/homoserine/homoserine lactone efflux protein
MVERGRCHEFERSAGCCCSTGLGALVIASQPLFVAIKWTGVIYLAFLAAQALRSAIKGQYEPIDGKDRQPGVALTGWRHGFLSNITNAKVLVFYLAVLPQFLGPQAGLPVLLAYALSHAALSLLYLTLLVAGMSRAGRLLSKRRVRRMLDALTGVALLGFGARLAAER